MNLPDLAVFLIYIAVVVWFGTRFAKRSRNTDGFTKAGGRLPGWAVGLSLFGTYLSSNTFFGNPGKAFSSNWSFYVFTLTIPLGAWAASKWFVPFYRKTGHISAYEHLEKRFGPWARTYTVICYLLTQISRMGTIMLGVAIGIYAVTGWDVKMVILTTGILVTAYTIIGGIEAVIWTDVVQSILLSIGALLVLGLLWLGEPGGSELLQQAVESEKLSLGDLAADFTKPSLWVIILYGIFINLANFGIDQNYIQRYHAARNESEARRAIWIGALAYIPVSALFFLIGTLLWGFYEAHPAELAQLAEMKNLTGRPAGDNALPHFMAHHLPGGVGGLLVAALFAAAMSTIDTSLNSSATITLNDLCKRRNRTLDDAGRMRILRRATLFWGALGTGVALILTFDSSNLLDLWWKLSGIFAGGMLGLFLLGILVCRANGTAASLAVIIGVLLIFWMSFAEAKWMPPSMKSPLDSLMTVTVGTLAIFLIGWIASYFLQSRSPLPNKK